MQRIALFQDLSGIGRAALATAMPVFGVLGVQPCALPTALLSAHTGYPGAVVFDQTAFLGQAIAHWDALGLAFDAVYTGYLTSREQAERIAAFIVGRRRAGDPFVVVDPVMADHGRLYRGIPSDMPEAMRALTKYADVITPNQTEARLLAGDAPTDEALTTAQARDLADALMELGCKHIVITGLRLTDGRVGNLLVSQSGASLCAYVPLDQSYPGTGDLFASVMTGRVLTGTSVNDAVGVATAFVYRAIETTLQAATPVHEGVRFEPLLATLSAYAGWAVTPFI